MASSSTTSSTSFSSKTTASPPPPPPHSPLFSPINEDEQQQVNEVAPAEVKGTYKHHATPLHSKEKKSSSSTSTTTTRRKSEAEADDDRTVSCNKCRPTKRDKISIIPLDSNVKNSTSTNPSPNNLFKSILTTLTRKSPNPNPKLSEVSRDEQWKLAVAELSHKLIQTTRKRDEAILESTRLKTSIAELEKKLNKLEIYCHNLKSGLEICNNNTNNSISSPYRNPTPQKGLVESFLNSVSESRSAVRFMSRSLTLQLRQMGQKVHERISTLLQPYDVKISFTKNPRSILFYLEALLNQILFEDFETAGFQKNGLDLILNPIEKCEANYGSYTVLQGLVWEDVLNKGTRHFSEEFSKFCDMKMSEIVAMLGWNRAWPEPLLQAFFSAAKSVWLVHLLACSVHPSLPIFRVDKGVKFDGVYMEDMGGDKARKLVPAMVRIMVAPGFYVYSNVVKCKVLCRYSNTQGSPIT